MQISPFFQVKDICPFFFEIGPTLYILDQKSNLFNTKKVWANLSILARKSSESPRGQAVYTIKA